MTALPVIVRPPKDENKDLSAIQDRAGQLRILTRQQRGTMLLGWIIVVLFFGVFGGWLAFMPLSGAVVTSGTLVAEGFNKPVQHYGGGIVSEILVRDGDRVNKGDVLLRLDPTDTDASAEVTEARYMAMLAEEARLLAERDGQATIEFPKALMDAAEASPEITVFIDAQEKVFDARQVSIAGQKSILKERISQSREEIEGLRAQITSAQTQLDLIKDEISSVQYLFDQGLAPKSRLLALKRQEANLIGQRGRFESTVARIEQSINETRLQIESLHDRFYADVVEKLKAVQSDLKDLSERRTVAEAAAKRSEVRAPVGGVVQGLDVKGVGQVVGNGQILMEIVPEDHPIVASLSLKPDNIDEVSVGQFARIKLPFYNFRTFSKSIDGHVTFVAADITMPSNSMEAQSFPRGFFKASVTLDRDEVNRYRESDHIELFTGAPVIAIIPTQDRTALEYLLGPLVQGLDQAFREQ